jgi:phosphatidylglycerophosphate synthase
VQPVRTGPVVGPVVGLLAQLAVLAALAGAVGLGSLGWVVGITCGVTTAAALALGLARHGADRLGPADRVTLARATIAGGVAALTAVALVLDAIDGWVARRTRTASMVGARFDMEVDAFLILVLSAYVARSTGAWVLTIGTARYAFVVGGWLLPWLRGTLPPRAWCKVVAATQGIVLTVAVADVMPSTVTDVALAVSLALLAESFGRQVWGLWSQRLVVPARWPRGGNEPAYVRTPSAVESTSQFPLTTHPGQVAALARGEA